MAKYRKAFWETFSETSVAADVRLFLRYFLSHSGKIFQFLQKLVQLIPTYWKWLLTLANQAHSSLPTHSRRFLPSTLTVLCPSLRSATLSRNPYVHRHKCCYFGHGAFHTRINLKHGRSGKIVRVRDRFSGYRLSVTCLGQQTLRSNKPVYQRWLKPINY